jgi:SAM-dependent methyltransferase
MAKCALPLSNLPSLKMPTTRELLKRRLLPFARGKVLDLGAGSAKYKPDILKYATEYLACDVVPGRHIDVVCDVLKLPMEDASFDTVICTQVLEHVKEPWKVAEEMFRILRPNGIIILTVPFNVIEHADPCDYYRFTLDGAKYLFERTGMKIVEAGKYSGSMAVLCSYCKFRFFDPYGKKMGLLRRNLFRLLQGTLMRLDRISPTSRMYGDVFVVAQKP